MKVSQLQDRSLTPEFLRAILDHSRDMLVVVDGNGQQIFSSQAVRTVLGYDPDERVGASIFDLIHPDDLPRVQTEFRAALASRRKEPIASEFRARHKDGGWRILELRGTNLLDHPVVGGILAAIRDVTAVRTVEAKLDRTGELIQDILDYLPVVLWKVDAEGVFELSEGRGLEGLGLEPGEVVGANIFDVYADFGDTLDYMRRALDGEAVEVYQEVEGRIFDSRIRPVVKDGEVMGAMGVALDVTAQAREAERAEFRARLLAEVGQAVIATEARGQVIYWNPRATEMYGWTEQEALGSQVTDLIVPVPSHAGADEILEQLRAGESWSGEYMVERKDGTQFPVHMSNAPVREDGELVAIIGVSMDLTERKRMEDRLSRAQKMEAVGQLAGGIAHDFNNLLTSIGGYAVLAAERTDDEEVAAHLEEVIHATKQARNLTGKLLAFSRRRTGRLETVDPNGMLARVVPVLEPLLGAGIRVETDLAASPWLVRADPDQLEQAILNLALNARDAMPDGGVLTIRTERVTLDPGRIDELQLGVAPGEYMCIAMEDTGVGIDPELRHRIFEPFFTTKPVGEGSGLGLSMVFGVMKQADGGISVGAAPGGGASFTLYLPRVETEERVARRPWESASQGGPPIILIVEDEPAVLSLARTVLEREGYEVRSADGPETAWKVLEEEPHVDLVVTDVIMPNTSGPTFIQRLRAHRPGIRSLFISGYAADEMEVRGLSREEEHFLPKPFTPKELAAAVEAALTR